MHFIGLVGVLLALSCTGIVMVTALDTGEVTTLSNMQQEWGSKLGWTGSPSCNWYGVDCDSNGHVYQLYVYIIFRGTFKISHQRNQQELTMNMLYYSLLSTSGLINSNLIFMITNYANIIAIRFYHLLLAFCRYLYDNELTGTIPDSIGNLQALSWLYVQNPK